jgi:RimJ/RimL family protein N-acetyltransferase
MTLHIPAISTARLTLRAPQESDFPTMLTFNDSPRSRFAGGGAARKWVWQSMLANVGHWAWRGYGFYSVDLQDGTFVGRVGVIYHDGWREPELAWHLFEGHEGHGYATEAAVAARDDYYARILPQPMNSMIDPENLASQAVARRLGAVLELEDTDDQGPVQVWRHKGPPA